MFGDPDGEAVAELRKVAAAGAKRLAVIGGPGDRSTPLGLAG